MKCSIIIPYSNDRNILNMLLKSLEMQEFNRNEFEIVFVNNSFDDLEEEIEQRKFNSQVNYHYSVCNEKGRSNARNTGINNSHGEILIFLDCDQIVGKDFVQQHCTFFDLYDQDDSLLQFGTRKHIFPIQANNQLINYDSVDELDNKYEILKIGNRKRITNASYYGNDNLNNYCYIEDIRHLVFKEFSNDISKVNGKFAFVQSNNFSIKKHFLSQYGGFDENFKGWGCEDWELGYRMQQNGIKILYNPNIEILHMYHNAKYDKQRFLEWKKNVNYFIEKYNKKVDNLLAFEEFFDPVKREQLSKRKDIDNAWLYCFRKFENSFK